MAKKYAPDSFDVVVRVSFVAVSVRVITAPGTAAPVESRARIEKEIEKLRINIKNSNRQLGDEVFVGKAPEKIVSTIRIKLSEYEDQLAKNLKLLDDAK